MSGSQEASSLKTLEVPAIGSSDPALLHQAAKKTVRVVIHNVGGNLVFLSHDVSALQETVAPSEVFQLAAGRELVVVLAPTQVLIAAGQGGGGQVSIAISEAMVKEWLSS